MCRGRCSAAASETASRRLADDQRAVDALRVAPVLRPAELDAVLVAHLDSQGVGVDVPVAGGCCRYRLAAVADGVADLAGRADQQQRDLPPLLEGLTVELVVAVGGEYEVLGAVADEALVVEARLGRDLEDGGAAGNLVAPRRHRHDHEVLGRPPEEGPVVPFHAALGVGERPRVDLGGLGRVGDVEERRLEALDAPVLVGVRADPDQQAVADGVQVGRVAGDLQLAEHRRLGRVGEIHDVQRINLAERHHVGPVADVAHGVDPLAAPHVPDAADDRQDLAVLFEGEDEALALAVGAPRRSVGHRHEQVPVVLVQGELVEQVALHRPGGLIDGGPTGGE